MDMYMEVEGALAILARECAERADRLRVVATVDEEVAALNDICVREYEQAGEEIDQLKYLVRALGLHLGDAKFCLSKTHVGDRVFRESYDRSQYKISSGGVRDGHAYLKQADYKAAALDILQMGFDRLDAAVLLDELRFRQALIHIKMIGRYVRVAPNRFENVYPSEAKMRLRSKPGELRRILDAEDLYMGLRLGSVYQRQPGFRSLTVTELGHEDEEPLLMRFGDLEGFKERVKSNGQESEAYYQALNYHRADWYEWALEASEAFFERNER